MKKIIFFFSKKYFCTLLRVLYIMCKMNKLTQQIQELAINSYPRNFFFPIYKMVKGSENRTQYYYNLDSAKTAKAKFWLNNFWIFKVKILKNRQLYYLVNEFRRSIFCTNGKWENCWNIQQSPIFMFKRKWTLDRKEPNECVVCSVCGCDVRFIPRVFLVDPEYEKVKLYCEKHYANELVTP